MWLVRQRLEMDRKREKDRERGKGTGCEGEGNGMLKLRLSLCAVVFSTPSSSALRLSAAGCSLGTVGSLVLSSLITKV